MRSSVRDPGGHRAPERDRLALGVDDDRVAVDELVLEQFERQRVLDQALNGPLERPRAERRVVALPAEERLGGVGDLELDALGLEPPLEMAELDLDDPGGLVAPERVEDHDLVDPVEELWPQGVPQLLHDQRPHLLGALVLAEDVAAQVPRHDQHRVTEVHRSPVPVRQPALVQHLEEDVEHVGVRLFDLVEEHDRVRPPSHGLGELPPFLVADVAGGGADQARDGVLLHVLGHVDADHRPLVVEEELGERPGQLGLAHAGGTEEQERTDRTIGIGQPRAGPSNRVGDGADRVVLADYPPREPLLHANEFLDLALEQPGHGDPGPLGDGDGDVLLVHLFAQHAALREEVDEEDIAVTVAKWTGIPVTRLLEGEIQKLVRMEERLARRVVGQDDAIRAVSNAVRRARSGLSDPNRPIGSFLFLGPTGVGKTELARALAEFLFDDERAMIRIDMSEYMEKHTVARLIGAPPGYVGYDEGGQLTEAVRRRPYSVVLFDEIEKAHADVFNVLLQLLDDGRLTDGHGRTVDFRNTVVIMTSNLGSHIFREYERPGKVRPLLMQELRNTLRPEFLNRIDEVVIFAPLGREEIARIVDIQLGHLRRRLAARRIELEVTDAARALLGREGYDPTFGARPLKRTIQRLVQDPLSLKLLQREISDGDTVTVDAEGEAIIFKRTAPAEVVS